MRMACVTIILLSSSFSIAGENSDWPSASAMDTGIGVEKEIKMYEKSMKSTIERIGGFLEKDCEWCSTDRNEYTDLLNNIRQNQSAWQLYAKAECELLYKLEGPSWNTWASTRYSQCQAGQAYNRLRQLKKVERCLESKNKGEKFYEFKNCIIQLAPLALQ